MENENLDLDVKPAANKDLWLFLIIVEIVLLCVFGFFLYKHFSAGLFQTQPSAEAVQTSPEESVLESLNVETIAEPAPAKPAKEESAESEKTLVAEVIAAEEKPASPAPAKAAPADKKQSVIVTNNPKSKYRRVTFRWFGEGKKVQIVSGFTMSKPQALKKKDGYWETTLSILPGTYKFLYIIDGQNTQDPYSPEKDGRSLVYIE